MQIDHVEITKLSLEPGDMLVVKVSPDIPLDNVNRAFERSMREAGVHVPVLVGHGDIEMIVIRAPKVTA